MRSCTIRTLMLLSSVSLTFSAAHAEDTHKIIGDGSQRVWHYNNNSSTSQVPVAVDDLKVDDIIEVTVAGDLPHGFITITQQPDGPIVETKEPVLACGGPPSKPNTVLRELCESGQPSLFAKSIPKDKKLRLQVMSTFKQDTQFYCIFHKAAMRGVLKLKQ